MNNYAVAGVDVSVVLEVLEDFIQMAIAGRSQETGLRIRLQIQIHNELIQVEK